MGLNEQRVADELMEVKRPSLEERARLASRVLEELRDARSAVLLWNSNNGGLSFQKAGGNTVITLPFCDLSGAEMKDYVKRMDDVIAPLREKCIKELEEKAHKALMGEFEPMGPNKEIVWR